MKRSDWCLKNFLVRFLESLRFFGRYRAFTMVDSQSSGFTHALARSCHSLSLSHSHSQRNTSPPEYNSGSVCDEMMELRIQKD